MINDALLIKNIIKLYNASIHNKRSVFDMARFTLPRVVSGFFFLAIEDY